MLFLIQGEQNFIAGKKEKRVKTWIDNDISYHIWTKDRSSFTTYIELLKLWLTKTGFFIMLKIRFRIYLETFLWEQILFYNSAQTRHLTFPQQKFPYDFRWVLCQSKTLETINHRPICLYPWFFTGQTFTCLVVINKNN